MSDKHNDGNRSVLQTNQITYKEFKANMLKLKHKKKSLPKRKVSKNSIKLMKLEAEGNNGFNLNFKRRNRSSGMRDKTQKNYHSNHLVKRTIEYHEKTMIEEFTDANIPEFTLGADTFTQKERPKPLSVNRMGFYEECKKLEVAVSPIKEKKKSKWIQSKYNIFCLFY